MNTSAATILAAVLLFGGAARADFVIDKVDAQRVDGQIQVRASMDLTLSDAAEQALAHGVPLIVVHEFELLEDGWIWNRVRQQASVRYRLRYHRLSGRYIVDSKTAALESFRTLSDALEDISRASATFDSMPLDSGGKVAVRSRIDINALPAPLRPTALFSPQWQLSSDWSQWPIDVSSTN